MDFIDREDLLKLYGTFVAEARERIAELESGLLDLENNPSRKDLVHSIFRAAHTIKGSSGSIELTAISEFSHAMEELLDNIRQGRLYASREVVSLLLRATDNLRLLVDGVISDCPNPASPESESLAAAMRAITALRCLRRFKVIYLAECGMPDAEARQADLLACLGRVGDAVFARHCMPDEGPLTGMEDERGSLRCDILLTTDKTEQEVKEILASFDPEGEFRLLPLMNFDSEVPFIGEVLVSDGFVQPDDVDEALRGQKKLGDILVEQGKARPDDVAKAVEKQREQKIEKFRKSVASTIRVDLQKLTQLVDLVGEMTVIHSAFQQTLAEMGALSGLHAAAADTIMPETRLLPSDAERLAAIHARLKRVGRDLQETAMSLRMLPVREVFQRFPRLVRELSASNKKRIELVVTGEDTELDKGMIERITDPLVHLIRNAIDHGIEEPEERLANGKPAAGVIQLNAYQRGDAVHIEVQDDGRGLNAEKILARAKAKGLVPAHAEPDDEAIRELIFLPGFSTAKTITDVSGRGVGMDIVRENIAALNGRISLHTAAGSGTLVSLRLPLTLAIVEGLLTGLGDQIFVIPVTSVCESFRPSAGQVMTLREKGEVISVRNDFIPFMRLGELLGVQARTDDPAKAIAVIVQHDGRKCGLMIDELLGEQQVVIKNLGAAMPRIPDLAGGTILGNGKVALVLDVTGILGMAGQAMAMERTGG